jgi:hypothetical protein
MYKHDDYLVMDGDTAALSQTSPEATIKYQRELAAVHNTIHSQERLVSIMSIERGVDGTLLSLLCTLLGISVINTPERAKHYKYYLQVRGSKKALPSTYLLDRLNSYEQVWGFPYGSLGYPMYYYPTTYVHPSRMVQVCTEHYLKGAAPSLDVFIQPIQEVLNNLQVLGDTLPQVADWYLTQGLNYSPLGDMEKKAYATLSPLARVWLRSGLCPITKGDVLHLTLPSQWRPLYEDLIHIRRASEWVPSASTGTQVEQLLLPFMQVSSLADPQGLRTAMSYVLGICAPGGWDLLLTVLAAQVINKAYVKAHQAPWDTSSDIGEAADLLGQAYAPSLQRVGLIIRRLNNARS